MNYSLRYIGLALLGAAVGVTIGWSLRTYADAQIIRYERTLARKAVRAAWERSRTATPRACANGARIALAEADRLAMAQVTR
jgi:hypothetical protein